MSLPEIATIIGSGTMGPGIAATLKRAGIRVRVYDISVDALTQAKKTAALAEDVLERLGVLAIKGGHITYLDDLDQALSGTQFVIEAVPEKPKLKKTVLAQIEERIDPEVIIATNTSGIPISAMSESMKCPNRFVGMHWSNPPHIIPMIEVIPGEQTDKKIVDRLIGIVKAFGYFPVLEQEIAGFVENRVLYAIMRECLALVQEGIVSQEDLDTCVKWGIGYKLSVVGPMRLLDMAGLDIYQSVSSYLNKELDASQGTPEIISRLIADNKLGFKSGDGMYNYGSGDVDTVRGSIVQGLVATRKALQSTPPV